MQDTGRITIDTKGVPVDDLERMRNIIHILISQGAFHVRNGTVSIFFDVEGRMRTIDFHIKRWKDGRVDYKLDSSTLGGDTVST